MSSRAPRARREPARASQRERNVEIARAAIDAFGRRDTATLTKFLAADIECRVDAEMMNAGTWHGPAGFAAMVAGWEEVWGRIAYEATGYETPDDEHVLIHIHQRAVGGMSGVPVELSVVYLIELRDRRAVRLEIHPNRDAALAAVGRREARAGDRDDD